MEVIDIVNKDLEFIRQGVRGENLSTNEYMKFVHIWVVKDNTVLIQKRGYNRRWAPGKWATHTGVIASKEDEALCASRELKEEMGIDLKITKDNLAFILRNDSIKGIGFIFFVNIEDEEIVIDNDEVIDYKFVDLKSLKTMINKNEFIYYYGKEHKQYFKKIFNKLTTMMEG